MFQIIDTFKTLKISEFPTFRPIFFACGKLLLSFNRFRTGILDFQNRPPSKSSFSAELCSKFSIFYKTLKISEFPTFRPFFFACGKLLLSSNRFRTGILDFQIRPSSKSSFSAEILFDLHLTIVF